MNSAPKSWCRFRFESRTIRVNSDRQIVFDSLPMGIHDGIGCLMDNGFQAILRRTKWELLIVSPQGVITERLPLWSMSKRMPRLVCLDRTSDIRDCLLQSRRRS